MNKPSYPAKLGLVDFLQALHLQLHLPARPNASRVIHTDYSNLCLQLIERIRQKKCLVESYMMGKSRFNKMIRSFPLYAVINDRIGLLGTREFAVRLLRQPDIVAKG